MELRNLLTWLEIPAEEEKEMDNTPPKGAPKSVPAYEDPYTQIDGPSTEKPVKDSGERQQFETGAQRDIQEGKPRPGLIHPYLLYRLGAHLAKGAAKYDDRNWEKGIPMSRFWDSLQRHLTQYAMGCNDEDHLAAALFNLQGLIVMPWMVSKGLVDVRVLDLPGYFAEEKHAE